jgi:thiol-disulfide isomerase/thioredoxin
LEELIKNDTDELLLVNVWATWCGPCIVELPHFVEMSHMYRHRKLKLVTISMDEPEQRDAALDVLKSAHVSAANYISAIADRDRFADLVDKEWAGPLPHTLLIAPGGKVLLRQNGSIEPLEVRRAIVDYLGRTYASRESQE